MSEGLMQGGSSGIDQSAYQSRGAGPHQEGATNQRSAYCKDQLMRGGAEFSFEELRAERLNQRRQQQLGDRLRSLTEEKQQLSDELKEKKKLLQLRKTVVVPEGSSSLIGPGVSSFHVYDESQGPAARPAGNELMDDVFLRPDEGGLCLQVQYPQPGAVSPSELDQTEDKIPDEKVPSAAAISSRPAAPKTPKLSPIQEASVEAGSVTSLGGCSPLEEDRDQEDQDQEDQDQAPEGGAVDPRGPDARRRLLDACDVTSSPDCHSELRPLPTVEEHSRLQLGGVQYHVFSTVVDGGSFSVYKGAAEENDVLVKVDRCSVLWDFHQFQRLKQSSPAAAGLPLISCFLFLDGSVTVYTSPPDHVFTELTECVPSEMLVGRKAVALLQLVQQLHSCNLLHTALQPHVLTCCHRGFLSPDWLFPVDWSSSVDLDLQPGVTSVQQVPSAQVYVSLGLLEPNAPPQLVDLVGVAETVHLLLTSSRMVAVKDQDGWTAEKFSGDEPCDMFSRMWRRFFRSLLNAGGGSSSPSSVLSGLKDELSSLYH